MKHATNEQRATFNRPAPFTTWICSKATEHHNKNDYVEVSRTIATDTVVVYSSNKEHSYPLDIFNKHFSQTSPETIVYRHRTNHNPYIVEREHGDTVSVTNTNHRSRHKETMQLPSLLRNYEPYEPSRFLVAESNIRAEEGNTIKVGTPIRILNHTDRGYYKVLHPNHRNPSYSQISTIYATTIMRRTKNDPAKA